MKPQKILDGDGKTHKYQQLIQSVIMSIENGKMKPGDKLSSINEMTAQNQISKVTAARAYLHLVKKGYISFTKGKGFYVQDRDQKLRVLLVFNKLSAYKRATYYGLLETLQDKATVDLQIHHYNIKLLDDILTENAGKYNYYVIMPHFTKEVSMEECKAVLQKIPSNKLLLLDRILPGIHLDCMAVYQDFGQDIYASLVSVNDLLQKYHTVVFLFPENRDHPSEVVNGVKKYCKANHKKFKLALELDKLERGAAYIAIEEEELGVVIKQIRKTNYKMGIDVGVVSFNETIMKELLDITVFTTDFVEMGRIAGRLLLSPDIKQVRNSFSVIRRSSL